LDAIVKRGESEVLSVPAPEPQIAVSPWTPWAERESVYSTDWGWEHDHSLEYGGVYVLGHFTKPPAASQQPHLDEEVIYIGMTSRLRSRPRQQHNKIKNEYRKRFSDESLSDLYLALYAMIDCFHINEPCAAFLAFYERKLIWQYAQRWGRLPILNTC
jgi:hypothetical protein